MMAQRKRYYSAIKLEDSHELNEILQNASFFENKNSCLTDFVESELPTLLEQRHHQEPEKLDLSKSDISSRVTKPDVPNDVDIAKATLICNTCNCTFETGLDQRQHYTLDWHRYNLKRKSLRLGSVTEEVFLEMLDGLSSISGSDDDEPSIGTNLDKLLDRTEEAASNDGKKGTDTVDQNKYFHGTPKVSFRSGLYPDRVFTVYKCLFPFHSKFQSLSSVEAFTHLKKLASRKPMIAVVMVSGGHFAAGIFQGEDEIVHKTFHSYTVRAKQGGSQGSRDSKSATSHPKSAGASLRRYNEQSFNQHVQDLLVAWKDKLEMCELILYRAVSGNTKILFGGGNTPGFFNKKDNHVKQIPFPTKRPTFKEVKRVLSVVTTIESQGVAELEKPKRSSSKFQKTNQKSPKESKTDSNSLLVNDNSVVAESKSCDSSVDTPLHEVMLALDLKESLEEFGDSLSPEERKTKKARKKVKNLEPVFSPPEQLLPLISAIQSQNEESALAALQEIRNLHNSEEMLNSPSDSQEATVLHLASKSNLCHVVRALLEGGCDPSTKDKMGKCPYNLAATKECRKVFMRYQADFPEKHDYRKAQIPGPLTKEQEKERAEKQKILNKQKREKAKLKLQEKKEKQAEMEEQQRFLSLSDREKRALAAEKRLLGEAMKIGAAKPVLVRCFECATDITGKVPFEYTDNVFCTPRCLAAHRKKFPTPLSL